MKIYIPEPIAEAGEKYLEFQGYEIFRGSGQTDKESLIRDIAECDAMILRTAKMDEEVLENGKKLRIVARHGAGYDNLDVKAAKKRHHYHIFAGHHSTFRGRDDDHTSPDACEESETNGNRIEKRQFFLQVFT